MESVTLSKQAIESSFDAGKCIICQENSEDKTVSENKGRKRIREASEIRNVSKRLKLVQGDYFVYHMTNQCYKKYTMKPTLER